MLVGPFQLAFALLDFALFTSHPCDLCFLCEWNLKFLVLCDTAHLTWPQLDKDSSHCHKGTTGLSSEAAMEGIPSDTIHINKVVSAAQLSGAEKLKISDETMFKYNYVKLWNLSYTVPRLTWAELDRKFKTVLLELLFERGNTVHRGQLPSSLFSTVLVGYSYNSLLSECYLHVFANTLSLDNTWHYKSTAHGDGFFSFIKNILCVCASISV